MAMLLPMGASVAMLPIGAGRAIGQAAATGNPPPASGATVKPQEHASSFLEDPFVTKYRRKFFSVFAGKTGEYEQGMRELEEMLTQNPNDARALVWHGNGLMVRAGLRRIMGKPQEARPLLVDSKRELDRAVSLDPENVNILAMRAVTLYIAGTYYPLSDLPQGSWRTIIDDLEKSRRIINPQRFPKLSVHARGQILSELAVAYEHTGQNERAQTLWKEIQSSLPNSEFARQADKALGKPAIPIANRDKPGS